MTVIGQSDSTPNAGDWPTAARTRRVTHALWLAVAFQRRKIYSVYMARGLRLVAMPAARRYGDGHCHDTDDALAVTYANTEESTASGAEQGIAQPTQPQESS